MDYSLLRLPVVEARLDWISCSARRNSKGVDLMNYADAMVRQHERSGDKISRYKAHGYEGWRCGNWAWGWGRPGAVVVVSQADAHYAASRLALLSDHWSRCDYCVTVRDFDGTIDPAEDYWKSWQIRAAQLPGLAKPSRIQTIGGGSTFTVGDRASAYFARVYNKSVESEGEYPTGCWRWELELKRHASEGQQRRWIESKLPAGYPLNLISTEFQRHGLSVPWQQETPIKRDPQVRPKPDVERTLAWLSRSVRPSVEFAVEKAGVEEVLKALNLPHVAYQES